MSRDVPYDPDQAEYECMDCGTLVDRDALHCPECGSQSFRNRSTPME